MARQLNIAAFAWPSWRPSCRRSLAIQLQKDDDAHHPLWPLVRHCTAVGILQETGMRPYMAEQVGEALRPLIDQASRRLVGERLDDCRAWED